MAKSTIEDCLRRIPNRFELSVLAVHRVRALLSGSKALVECNDSEIVIALREIAAGVVDVEDLRNIAMNKHRGIAITEESRKDVSELFSDDDMDLSKALEGYENNKEGNDVSINLGVFSDRNLVVED